MITATGGTNRELAEKFAATAREMGHDADIADLSVMDFPMFTVARSKELDVVPGMAELKKQMGDACLLYTSPSPRDSYSSRMPSSA